MDRNAERDFEGFVAASGQRLLRAAYLISGNRADAEDLHQTVLERVARRWERLSGDPESYARVVLAHAATDRWRRRGARPMELFTDSTLSERAIGPDATAGVDARLDLISLLRNLPPRQRAVLVLRFFYDLSEADTARELGISVGTVKSTTSRALSSLRSNVRETIDGMEATP